jgi:hypothetical protein
MNEQNRLRLDRIATRHAKRAVQGRTETPIKTEVDTGFLAAFGRVRDEVLQPVMAEVGLELKAAGHRFRISPGGEAASPAVDFHILLPEPRDSKDTIRFLARKDAERGWQVIAELELKGSPVEITRFESAEEITRDVAEQLVVDATEQMFASALAVPRTAPLADAPASTLPMAAEAAPPDTMPSMIAEAPLGARALVVERLRLGRRLHGLDLAGADLHGLDFTGALMSALDLRGANLQGCVLAGARLTAAQLGGADLTDAILTGADLTRADLTCAVLVRTRLDGASLVHAIGAPSGSPEQVVPDSAERAGEEAKGEGEPAPAIEPTPEVHLPPLTDESELRWARWAGAAGLGETEEVSVVAFRGAALPFLKGPPAPPFASPVDTGRSQPRLPRGTSTGHETIELPTMAERGLGESTLITAGAPQGTSLTVEQYAAFCAELVVFADHAVDVHRKYGVLTVDARAALDKAFVQRFSAEPGLQQRWRALVVHYQDWYRGQAPK